MRAALIIALGACLTAGAHGQASATCSVSLEDFIPILDGPKFVSSGPCFAPNCNACGAYLFVDGSAVSLGSNTCCRANATGGTCTLCVGNSCEETAGQCSAGVTGTGSTSKPTPEPTSKPSRSPFPTIPPTPKLTLPPSAPTSALPEAPSAADAVRASLAVAAAALLLQLRAV